MDPFIISMIGLAAALPVIQMVKSDDDDFSFLDRDVPDTEKILTAMTEWRIQPHRKAYFENLREIALRVEAASDEELAKFEERPTLVRESLRVLKDCNLNVYHQPSVARRSDSSGKQ